ncbi:hypothetical protein Krac_10332 [Ktedonobacter racemifer DSM 44963]|uniref:Uncharacterized protein n=2 Tax=Ktedonobacter racemifer TaxID=363277 RepID=D6TGQ1_KTERA|nr:hypothetical protein Krac_10332 [Ktedonobacter racemifer DSM 44963]
MALSMLHLVPLALQEQVQQLFGSQDRRCLNGQVFLNQWLRVASIKQIPLVPHEPPHPVAVLTIQNLRAFCSSPSHVWPWCYDSTAKYLSVLQAAGLLYKVRQPKGMGTTYYFPLTSTPCLPVSVEQVQQLTHRRKSVKRSRALQRVSAYLKEQTTSVESDHDGKEASDMKTRPGYLSLVPPPQQGQGPHDHASQTMEKHSQPSGVEEQAGRTVERLTAMMQSYGMHLTPAVKASIATIIWEELTHPTQAVSSQPPEEREPVPSFSGTQTKPAGAVMHHDRTMMRRQSRRFRRRSRIVEEDPRPERDRGTPEENRRLQPTASTCVEQGRYAEKPSTSVEDRRPGGNTLVLEGERRPQAKPSTSVENRRPVVQETVDLGGAQTQTQEAHTRTRAHARVEFTSLTNHQLPKKEIDDKSEDEVREQGLTKKQVDGLVRTGEPQGRPSAACIRREVIDEPSPTPASPAQVDVSLVPTEDEADAPFRSLRDQVAAMKRVYEPAAHEMLEALALDYSERFSETSEKVGVYLKRLREHPEWLHVAAVDALVRTWFPDPGRRAARLGGGWVIKKYREYVDGLEEPPAEMVAWAQWMLNGGLSYNHLEWVLEGTARSGRITPGEGKRPLPHEVMIDAEWLQEFWAAGGAQGLERYGYLFVDRDGEFLTPQEYERHRQAAVNDILTTPYDLDDAEARYEIQTYLAWAESQRLPAEEEQALLTDLPRPLQQWVSALHRRIDTDCYRIGVRLAPRSRRRVIEIIERANPERVWHLEKQQQILAWLEWYARVAVVAREMVGAGV